MKLIYSTVILITLFAFPASRAHAYIDPSTGSYFFQIILAALIGVPLFFRSSLFKVKEVFVSYFSSTPKKPDSE